MLKKSISTKEYLLFAEAWLFLAIARCMLLFFPFKKIAPVLGYVNGKKEMTAMPDNGILGLVSLSIKRACRYSPWRTKCFEQAIAAKIMLKRRKAICTIFFGVPSNMNSGEFTAHAWLESNGMVITGGGRLERYTVLGSFTG